MNKNELNELIKNFEVILLQKEEAVKNNNVEHAYNLILQKKNIPDLIGDRQK